MYARTYLSRKSTCSPDALPGQVRTYVRTYVCMYIHGRPQSTKLPKRLPAHQGTGSKMRAWARPEPAYSAMRCGALRQNHHPARGGKHHPSSVRRGICCCQRGFRTLPRPAQEGPGAGPVLLIPLKGPGNSAAGIKVPETPRAMAMADGRPPTYRHTWPTAVGQKTRAKLAPRDRAGSPQGPP